MRHTPSLHSVPVHFVVIISPYVVTPINLLRCCDHYTFPSFPLTMNGQLQLSMPRFEDRYLVIVEQYLA